MRKFILAILFLAICPLLGAQQAMNNDSVIKMVAAGFSDDLIIATISASPGNYDISATGLIALKSAGASDKVLAVIVTKATQTSVSAPTAASPVVAPAAAISDPNDPMAEHDVGVYLMTTTQDGKQRMIFIERAGEASEKTSNMMGAAFSYGIAKVKIKAEIPGPHSAVRTTEIRPVFYMYFPSISNLGGFGGTRMITSPMQFSLLSLEEKKDHRETTVGEVGMASSSAGSDEKRAFLFNAERIRSGIYKVAPTQDLKPGEYAFISATRGAGTATGTTVVIYDFGVDAR